LPQKLYNEHSKDLKGVIMFIDEFQVLKDLENNLDNFLWFFRSLIQNQKNVAYVFSGSLNSKDDIIERIAGRSGAFGGRMLTIKIDPFTKETVHNYLNERLPSLKLKEDGFERFYKCTNGVPFYVNTFANLLQKNTYLGDNEIKNEFKRILPLLADHLKQKWGGLKLNEQKIVTCLIDRPLRRKEISRKMGIASTSLSKPLNKLQNVDLIIGDMGLYSISEPILKAWLKQEYETKGVFPFRAV